MTKLSVIIITRNQAWNTARLIKSVLEHTASVPSREIVLVDSASTDATVSIASRTPITVIRLDPDQRLTAALGRAVGYAHTTGDYVFFMDGDMELIPGWVDQAIGVMDAHPDIAGIAGELHERPVTYRGSGLSAGDDQYNFTNAIFNTRHGGGAAMYRRSALEQAGGFDPQFYSDEEPELCMRLRSAGFRIVRMKHAIAFHYSDPRHNISTLLRRRSRNLYVGGGQIIRNNIDNQDVLRMYVRERGFGVLPGIALALLAPLIGFLALTGRGQQIRRIALLGSIGLGADSIRRGSIYKSVYAILQRLIQFEGLVRGYTLPLTEDITPHYKIIKHAGDDMTDIPDTHVHDAAEALPMPDRKPPRVLVVGPVFRGGQAGGIEMFNDILFSSDLAQKYDLRHLDTTRTASGHGKAGTLALINFYYFFRQIVELIVTFIFRRPAVMHQPITDRIAFWKEGVFMLLARLFGVPVVGHVHGCMFKELIEGKNWFVKQAVIAVLKLPNLIIALSEGWRTFMLENIDPNLSVVVVANTVDAHIGKLAHRENHVRGDGPVKVLYMASLHKRKGLLEALEAVKQVHAIDPSVQFIFAGGIKAESERAEIEQAQAALSDNPNVIFPGIVTGDEKTRLFEEADIFILPSYFENFPIAVLEAMAAGLPLIVTPVGALPEVLHEGEHCLFIEAGDVDGLADRLKQLVAAPEQRAAMGAANATLFRQEFDRPAILAKIEHAYLRAMNHVVRAS